MRCRVRHGPQLSAARGGEGRDGAGVAANEDPAVRDRNRMAALRTRSRGGERREDAPVRHSRRRDPMPGEPPTAVNPPVKNTAFPATAMSLTQPVSPMAATPGDQAIERPVDPDTATMQGGAAHAVATQARPASGPYRPGPVETHLWCRPGGIERSIRRPQRQDAGAAPPSGGIPPPAAPAGRRARATGTSAPRAGRGFGARHPVSRLPSARTCATLARGCPSTCVNEPAMNQPPEPSDTAAVMEPFALTAPSGCPDAASRIIPLADRGPGVLDGGAGVGRRARPAARRVAPADDRAGHHARRSVLACSRYAPAALRASRAR